MKLVLSSTIISSLAALPATVYGHGYLETPMARNLYAHREGRSGNPSNAPAIPLYQTTPQGLNRNKNVCGMDQGYPDNDYDSWLDTQGNPMPWISQAIYNPGDIIEVNSFLTAHHKGYLEVKGCPRGRDSTQECFDSYPLEFVKDLLYDMPQDTAYPNRGYLHGVEPRLSMQFKLPEGLVGEQVLLQWVYWTANSCNPIGFAEYYSTPKPVGPTGPNWNSLLSTCPPESETPIAPIPNPNSSVLAPERFINCAEVTVTGVQTPAPPFPSPIPPPTSAPVENPVTSPPVSQPPINPGIVGTLSSPVAPPTSAPVENPVTSPPVSQPPINPEIVGTCGGGNTGNGICPVHSMCCSKWGYCGYESTGHCDDPAPIDAPSNPIPMPVSPPVSMPVDAPTLPLPPTHDHHDDNSRLIAYLGNWQSCPSDEQVARYTHIVIAFAVSYTWSPGKNVCSETCEIMVPPVCGDAARPDLIQKWKNMGKKVILSFGGAGMGGSWVGDNNDCWDYCFGRETQVVDRLTDIVNEMGLDGIDIDYEYFYEDHQNGSGFTKGAEAQNFLSQVTIGLRDSMPAGFELTHAPMEPDMVPGKGYFEVLKEVASSLDFLMPQYYNGYVQSHSNFDGALDHYTTLANQMFNGDASKIVYGFCINDCGSFNLDGYESAEVMEWLSKEYPCNGGAFFWVANDDRNSEWSIPVRDQLLIDSEQC
ncbi:unnamed protein product [Pseudo-nitzschia multistriata]|uniref:GH18 domain-containing protein n=1 Tax=Pseudo-nitzschia multistriata TaxID=183589 RepID=A0A448ZNS3_9STRA|nr:unnamed protein product [Pseudo-nitzschia multistriata]